MIRVAVSLTLLVVILLVPLTANSAPPEIGTAARVQTSQLGPGWHYGFFNQIRTKTPCYIIMFFEERSSSKDPLRIRATVPIEKIIRLQISIAPGSSMGEWDGYRSVVLPDSLWQEVSLEPLLPEPDSCNYDFSNK